MTHSQAGTARGIEWVRWIPGPSLFLPLWRTLRGTFSSVLMPVHKACGLSLGSTENRERHEVFMGVPDDLKRPRVLSAEVDS